VGGTSGYDAQIPVNRLFMNHLSLRGSTMGAQADYERVMRLVFEGSLNPVIDRVFGARGYGAAVRHLCSGIGYGKVLVDLHDWREWPDG
jgi:D-arabinose 1-dehydrogenase-like Zn-dependent alcohol dehydrogenase